MPVDVVRRIIDRYDLLARLAEGDAMRYIEILSTYAGRLHTMASHPVFSRLGRKWHETL